MHPINRRSFFRSLGLGAGATLLGPIYDTLVREAWGAPLERKTITFLLNGQGNVMEVMLPPEGRKDPGFAYSACGRQTFNHGELLPGTFAWPVVWKALEPWRNRTVLLDGLGMKMGGSQHTGGYATLTGLDTLGNTPEKGGGPAGPSIDQFIAERIGRETPIKSVLIGMSRLNKATHTSVFASGVNKPEPFIQSPGVLFAQLFGGQPIMVAGKPGLDKRRVLMDVVRTDIKKLQANLVGSERQKLDHYLAAIADLEMRIKASPAVTCQTPAKPGEGATAEDKLEILTDMATLALVCGLTNVVGISAACGHGHGGGTTSWGRVMMGGWPGHSPIETKIAAAHKLYPFYASLMVKLIEGMSNVKVSGKTLFDNSTILFTNDNGIDHHDEGKRRHPMVLVGNAGGFLAKVDGRYLRFGDASCAHKNPDNAKEYTMPDLFGTLAAAVGAQGTFAEGAGFGLKGPIREMLSSG